MKIEGYAPGGGIPGCSAVCTQQFVPAAGTCTLYSTWPEAEVDGVQHQEVLRRERSSVVEMDIVKVPIQRSMMARIKSTDG